MMPKKKITTSKNKRSGHVPGNKDKFICFNKECKLRKQKSCKGFEGCPGYLGK
jgi:hypothetical protein